MGRAGGSLHCGVASNDPSPPGHAAGDDAERVVLGLWSSLATSRVVADLAARGVPVMVLKGPPLQQRLLGTESAYRSADVDLLVPRRQGRQARARLQTEGWRPQPGNGLLWRLDRAVALERRGVVIDLHWGIHLGSLPPWTLASLEQALWSGATRAEGGWWEPRPEPLLVYLALHAAAFEFSKPAGLVLVVAAAGLVEDWPEVELLSRRLHAWPAVEHAVGRALGGASRSTPPMLQGMTGRLLLTGTRLVRIGLLPEGARGALRTARDRLRR